MSIKAVDIEKLSASELVTFAGNKGLAREIRGMTTEGVKELLKKFVTEAEIKIAEPEVSDISQPQVVTFESLSWIDIKRLAKARDIKIFKKKRSEIETLLKEKEVEGNALKKEGHSILLREEAEGFIKATDEAEAKKKILVVPELPKEVKEILTENKGDIRKQIEDLTDLVLKAAFAATETNKRIDRIVIAIDKSKSVRGL